MHGGAGALISIGMFRQVLYEDMHKCIQQAYSSGGDGFITECLWEVRTDKQSIMSPGTPGRFMESTPGSLAALLVTMQQGPDIPACPIAGSNVHKCGCQSPCKTHLCSALLCCMLSAVP